MAGFGVDASGNEIMYSDNVDFSGNQPLARQLTTNGQLLIGSTVAPNIKTGILTSPLGTVTIGYSSPNITIDLTGGAAAVEHLTGDTGGQLNPTANNFNILGLSGSKTSGSGSTLTVKSPPYADFPATATASVNSGSFITAGGNIILNLPTPASDGDLVEVVCTTANLVAIDAAAANFVRIGTLITSGGGTATSTQIGDAVCLRFRLADLTWYATSAVGTWVMA